MKRICVCDARSIGDHSFFFFLGGGGIRGLGGFFLRIAVIFLRGNRFFLLFHGHVDLTDQKSDIYHQTKFEKKIMQWSEHKNKNCDHLSNEHHVCVCVCLCV